MAGSSCFRSSYPIALFISVALAVLVGGCGSSHVAGSSPIAHTSTVAPPAAARVSDTWPLTDRVVAPAAFPGFARPRRPIVISSALTWASFEQASSPARESARLRALGFVRGVNEHLDGRFPVSAEVVSTTEQYKTAAGARAELSYQFGALEHAADAEVSVLSVPGIPGARGIRIASGGNVGLNVLFSAGPYFYIVATGHPEGARRVPTTANLLAGASLLYLAVNGCAAPTSA